MTRDTLREIVRVKDELHRLCVRIRAENEFSLADDVGRVGERLWEVTHRQFAYSLVDELRKELSEGGSKE